MRTAQLAATTPYNKKEIIEKASMITVTKKNGIIITKNGDKVTSKYRATKAYEIVDFADAVKQLLNAVDKIYKPEFYQLTCHTGFQELKLRGKAVNINGDTFHEMMWLTTLQTVLAVYPCVMV